MSELAELSSLACRHACVFVLGGGSNVVLPAEVRGLIVKLETRGVRLVDETQQDYIVEAQGGESWHGFVQATLQNGWPGLENLALIPGSVGAAPVQNIGAYGVELDQRFHSLTAWDLHTRSLCEFDAEACEFSYRDSFFKRQHPGRWIIVAVRFRLPKHWAPVLDYPELQRHDSLPAAPRTVQPQQIFEAICEIRRRKLPDPAVLGNAGSFFKNPVVDGEFYIDLRQRHPGVVAYSQGKGAYKLAAGWLIDQAGWKGRRAGTMGVHERQALVLVNHGGATALDVRAFAGAIRDDIRQKFGVELEQEPIDVGRALESACIRPA